MSGLRPLPGDPDSPYIKEWLDISTAGWLVMSSGDVKAAGVEQVETLSLDSGQSQRLIAVELPTRINKTSIESPVRLLIDPLDALQLAGMLAHSAKFMLRQEGP